MNMSEHIGFRCGAKKYVVRINVRYKPADDWRDIKA